MKKHFIKIAFTTLILLIGSVLYSQNREIDSLKSVLKKYQNNKLGSSVNIDTNVIQTNFFLCKNLFDIDLNQSKRYGLNALNILDSINSSSKTFNTTYYNKKYTSICRGLSLVFDELGEPNIAINYLEKSLPLINTKDEIKDIIKWYHSLGALYSKIGNYKQGLNYGFKCLECAEKINFDKGICGALKCLANIYAQQNKLLLALPYYERIIKIREKNNDADYLVDDYNNIANCLDELGRGKESLNYLLKALTYSKKIKSLKNEAFTYNNLAYYYLDKEQFNIGLDCALKSYNIRDSLNDIEGKVKSLYTVCISYTKLSQFNKSINGCKLGLANANKIENISLVRDFNQLLFENYKSLNDFENALKYHITYIVLKDSLLNINISSQFNEMQTKYQTEKKENENNLLQTENKLSSATIKQQKIITYIIIGSLLVVSSLAFFIFKGLKKQRKANAIISEQKIIVEHQKHLVEEKHKEITDSINYAERIQRSFLASKELLDQYLKEYFVFFQPKDVVSGDFYWASKIVSSSGVENFVLATADSTGHGVPGAIMSLLNITSLESAIKNGHTRPADILNSTRKTIIERLKKDGSIEGGKDGMDCSLICFDFNKNIFTYSAANNPVWIVRENQLIELVPDKMPVGKHDKDQISFTQNEFQLQKGDIVYALTDGLPDQFGGPKGKKFMYKKLKEFLISISDLTMVEQKQHLKSVLDDWKGDLEQVDDVCVIGVKV